MSKYQEFKHWTEFIKSLGGQIYPTSYLNSLKVESLGIKLLQSSRQSFYKPN